MPQSKQRKAHKHLQQDYIPHKKKRVSVVPHAILVCTILALGITWFAIGPSVLGLIAGGLLGILIGYVAGKQMDKAFDK